MVCCICQVNEKPECTPLKYMISWKDRIRKDHVYKVIMTLDYKTYDINTATCGCPADKSTTASCKHVGALCYALVEFCTLGKISDFLSCTNKLQAWNRPKPKKVNPIPMTDFFLREKWKLLKSMKRSRASHSMINDHLLPKYAIHCWKT